MAGVKREREVDDPIQGIDNQSDVIPTKRHKSYTSSSQLSIEHEYRERQHDEDEDEDEEDRYHKRIDTQTAFIRLRGLPFQATKSDIIEFFQNHIHFSRDYLAMMKSLGVIGSAEYSASGLEKESKVEEEEDRLVAESAIVFDISSKDGRVTGEAMVALASEADVEIARSQFHNRKMGHRYIEVYVSSRGEWEKVLDRVLPKNAVSGLNASNVVIRVRGIPYGSSEEDVRSFFKKIQLIDVFIPMEDRDRIRGDAFIVVADDQAADIAMQFHKQYMGRRYVELIRSTQQELELAKRVRSPGSPPRRGGRGSDRGRGMPSRCLMLQGLPFETSRQELLDFFQKARVVPSRLVIAKRGGRAFAMFDYQEDHDAAMTLHKEYIGRRYVELIPIPEEEFYEREMEILGPRGLPVRHGYGPPPPPSHYGYPRIPPPRDYYYDRAYAAPPRGDYYNAYHYPEPAYADYSNLPYYDDRGYSPRGGEFYGRGGYEDSTADYDTRGTPRSGGSRSDSGTYIVKLTGLPFNTSLSEIRKFFHGYSFDEGSVRLGDSNGTFDGSAKVAFYSDQERYRAIQACDMKLIGDNTIRLFNE